MAFGSKSWEFGFIEDNIAGDDNLLRLGVVTLPPLVSRSEAEEDALLSMRTQIGGTFLLANVDVGPTSEDSKAGKIWLALVPELKGCGV